jgi:DNA polymerase III epsilon subunit family exonuclease
MADLGSWLNARFIVVDVEGNGRQPPDIVELAAVSIEPGGVMGTPRGWLVRPAETISHIVTRLHGITNDMVADAPRFDDISREVCDTLSDAYLVAHNAKIEVDILSPRLSGWNPRGVIDTLKLARQLLPGRKSYALSALTEDLGLGDTEQGGAKRAHRAAYDVLVTARLFMHLAKDDHGAPRPLSLLLGNEPVVQKAPPPQGRLF